MYKGVPTIEVNIYSLGISTFLEKPKSASLYLLSFFKMFSGFKSL